MCAILIMKLSSAIPKAPKKLLSKNKKIKIFSNDFCMFTQINSSKMKSLEL